MCDLSVCEGHRTIMVTEKRKEPPKPSLVLAEANKGWLSEGAGRGRGVLGCSPEAAA